MPHPASGSGSEETACCLQVYNQPCFATQCNIAGNTISSKVEGARPSTSLSLRPLPLFDWLGFGGGPVASLFWHPGQPVLGGRITL